MGEPASHRAGVEAGSRNKHREAGRRGSANMLPQGKQLPNRDNPVRWGFLQQHPAELSEPCRYTVPDQEILVAGQAFWNAAVVADPLLTRLLPSSSVRAIPKIKSSPSQEDGSASLVGASDADPSLPLSSFARPFGLSGKTNLGVVLVGK
jgi:hypothetical protein